jgi:hypothetical protein
VLPVLGTIEFLKISKTQRHGVSLGQVDSDIKSEDSKPQPSMVSVSLLFVWVFHMISPVSAVLQSIAVDPVGALRWNISWVDEVGMIQGYDLIVRHLPYRTSYTMRGLSAGTKFFVVDSTTAHLFLSSAGVEFQGLRYEDPYSVQVFALV